MDNISARPNVVVEKLRTLKDKIIPSDDELWARRKESPRYGYASCSEHSPNWEIDTIDTVVTTTFYFIGFILSFWWLSPVIPSEGVYAWFVLWLIVSIILSSIAGLGAMVVGVALLDVFRNRHNFEKCVNCRAAWLKNEKENWLQPIVDDYPFVCEVFAKRWSAVVSVGLSDKEVGKEVSNLKHDLITLDTIRDIFEFIAKEMSGFIVTPLPKDEYGWEHSLITYRGVDVIA